MEEVKPSQMSGSHMGFFNWSRMQISPYLIPKSSHWKQFVLWCEKKPRTRLTSFSLSGLSFVRIRKETLPQLYFPAGVVSASWHWSCYTWCQLGRGQM